MSQEIDVEKIKQEALEELNKATNRGVLLQIKGKYLGRKGIIQQNLKKLPQISIEERKKIGPLLNRLKNELEEAFKKRFEQLEVEEYTERITAGIPDPTLPAGFFERGAVHPITQTLEDIISILKDMGFELEEGPEVETDFYNFEALNIPPDHPARTMHDTFYVAPWGSDRPHVLLRTHTSPVQVRVMQKKTPPIKMMAVGKVYRRDADISHSPMFHQVEGLYVDRGVTFAHLKATLLELAKRLFGEGSRIRIRPSFFPFTEPSVEVDVSCFICGGRGCRTCGWSGWIEILGAGMVDPEVFRMSGIDPQEYRGFAFGLGVERIAMLRYGIDDIRLFFDNDIRFLKQFR